MEPSNIIQYHFELGWADTKGHWVAFGCLEGGMCKHRLHLRMTSLNLNAVEMEMGFDIRQLSSS